MSGCGAGDEVTRCRSQRGLLGRLRRSRAGERGQSLVELALIVPVLLVIVFAVAEFGFMINNQIVLVHAARDGARAGSAVGCNLVASCEQSAATTQAATSANGLVFCGSAYVAPTPPVTGSNPQQISVTVKCDYTSLTPLGALLSLIGGHFTTSFTMSATAKMNVAQ